MTTTREEIYRDALERITKPEAPFAIDKLLFAQNVIDRQIQIATKALEDANPESADPLWTVKEGSTWDAPTGLFVRVPSDSGYGWDNEDLARLTDEQQRHWIEAIKLRGDNAAMVRWLDAVLTQLRSIWAILLEDV